MKISTNLTNGKRTVTPYLAINGGALKFIEFAKQAFDAEEYGHFLNPDGTVGHAEIRVGDSTIMLFDTKPEWPRLPSLLSIYIDDVDDVYRKAIESGATVITELMEFEIIGDRAARVKDPFGNLWWLQTHIKDVSEVEAAKLMQDTTMLSKMQKAKEDADKFFSAVAT